MATTNSNKPDTGNADKGNGSSNGRSKGKVVQLQTNQAGHLAGETFKEADAKKLGILDHCTPFKG